MSYLRTINGTVVQLRSNAQPYMACTVEHVRTHQHMPGPLVHADMLQGVVFVADRPGDPLPPPGVVVHKHHACVPWTVIISPDAAASAALPPVPMYAWTPEDGGSPLRRDVGVPAEVVDHGCALGTLLFFVAHQPKPGAAWAPLWRCSLPLLEATDRPSAFHVVCKPEPEKDGIPEDESISGKSSCALELEREQPVTHVRWQAADAPLELWLGPFLRLSVSKALTYAVCARIVGCLTMDHFCELEVGAMNLNNLDRAGFPPRAQQVPAPLE